MVATVYKHTAIVVSRPHSKRQNCCLDLGGRGLSAAVPASQGLRWSALLQDPQLCTCEALLAATLVCKRHVTNHITLITNILTGSISGRSSQADGCSTQQAA